MDRLISMILRRLLNIGINKGIKAGMGAVGKRGRNRNSDEFDDDETVGRNRQQGNRQQSKAARQALRVARRMNTKL